MDKRRELILQRLSRIGSLATADVPQNTKFKGKPAGAMTIEAAIGTYMMRDNKVYDLRSLQDTYTQGGKDSKYQELLSRQMSEYRTAIEENQLANARSGLFHDSYDSDKEKPLSEKMLSEKLDRVLANDPSARYQLSKYYTKPKDGARSTYDKLDANRCSGFLLYSYDKNGVHSVLGEHITPGSKHGHIVNGT